MKRLVTEEEGQWHGYRTVSEEVNFASFQEGLGTLTGMCVHYVLLRVGVM